MKFGSPAYSTHSLSLEPSSQSSKAFKSSEKDDKVPERKKLKSLTSLSKHVLPSIDIPPILPILSIVCVQRTTVPSQAQVKPTLSFSKTILTHFKPENYQEVHYQTSQKHGEYKQNRNEERNRV